MPFTTSGNPITSCINIGIYTCSSVINKQLVILHKTQEINVIEVSNLNIFFFEGTIRTVDGKFSFVSGF